jgi:hypothetical protein
MAKVHIYVRSQAQVSSADADAIAGLFAQAQTIVEASGGEWTGSVAVLDAEPVVVPEPVADAVEDVVADVEPVKEPVKAKKRKW